METGEFVFQESMFFAGGNKYIVKHRKKPTNKPELYLAVLQPGFQYISSLFPVPGTVGEYTFDYQRQLYRLKQAENKVKIERL